MGGILRLERDLPQAQRSQPGLASLPYLLMAGKARLHPLCQNLAQTDIQRIDQVYRRRGEIGCLPRFVSFHNGQPVIPVGVIVEHR